MNTLSDELLAQELQKHFDNEATNDSNYFPKNDHTKSSKTIVTSPSSLVDSKWELIDPCPDPRALFMQFNDQFFWGKLAGVEVKWSLRMTLCAGVCSYEGHGGLCSIRLSGPLLKLRPRKDLVETLLHEMIHAYLFVTANNRDRDGHGPEFQKHMNRINQSSGTAISIYHSFHDEVDNYRQHWWRCDGPCQKRKPYFGFVKRAMNRAPSQRVPWWAQHQQSCGGKYHKIKEPEGYGKTKKKEKPEKEKPKPAGVDIRTLFGGKGNVLGGGKSNTTASDNKPTTSRPIEATPSGRSITSISGNKQSGSPPVVAGKSSVVISSSESDENDTSWCEEETDLQGFDWSVFDEDYDSDGEWQEASSSNVEDRSGKRKSSDSSAIPVDSLSGKNSQNKRQKISTKETNGVQKTNEFGKSNATKSRSDSFKNRIKLPRGKISTAAGGKASESPVNSREIDKMFKKKTNLDGEHDSKPREQDSKQNREVQKNPKTSELVTSQISKSSESATVVDLTSNGVAEVQRSSGATASGSGNEEIVSCPVCQGIVVQSKINQHLDLCLG